MRLFATLLALSLFLVSACSKVEMPGVHRIPIQQGNYLEYKDVAQIEPGMTKDQVEAILGTPVVSSLFNQDRWEYVYKLRTEQYGKYENLYVVWFEDDVVARVESDIQAPEPTTEMLDVEEELPPDEEEAALKKADELLDSTSE